MAQEEQAQRCNISGINAIIGRSSAKKPKDKKIPQRGLGVAQLEKIRLEEQQKNYHHHSNQFSSVSNFISPSDNIEAPRPKSEITGDFNVPNNLWNIPCDHIKLAHQFNPIWAQQSYQAIPSVVKFPPTPSSPLSMSSFQMELPSNQSYHGNYHDEFEEVKILGNKRRYMSVQTDQQGSSLNYKFLTFSGQTRVDGSTSSDNRVTFNPEQRDSGLSSTLFPEPNSTNNVVENSVSNGNFLTLCLPTSSSPDLRSHFDCKIPNFSPTPLQGIVNGQKFEDEQSGSSQYKPFYSFFPPAKRHNYESADATRHFCTSGIDDQNVDLNLKL